MQKLQRATVSQISRFSCGAACVLSRILMPSFQSAVRNQHCKPATSCKTTRNERHSRADFSSGAKVAGARGIIKITGKTKEVACAGARRAVPFLHWNGQQLVGSPTAEKMALDANHAIAAVVRFSNKLRELENRCEAMKQAEAKMRKKNEAQRQHFEQEKQNAVQEMTANFGQLTAHMENFRSLKTLKDMVEGKERLIKQIIDYLVKTVDQKNDLLAASRHQFVVLRSMVSEVNSLRLKAEENKRNIEEQHKRDLEGMQLHVQAKEAVHASRVLVHEMELTRKLRAVESRCEAMKQTEVQMRQKNEAERQQFDQEKQNVVQKLTVDLEQLTAHMQKFRNLKTLTDWKDMVEETERLKKQIVDDLVKTVDQKNDLVAASRHQFVVLRSMVSEVDSLRLKAEEDKKNMEELHKRDLEAMQLQVQAKAAIHTERVMAHQMALTNKLRAIESRCEAMKQTEVQMWQKNEAEIQQFEREKQIGENKALEMAVQEQKKKLMERQQLELQKQHVKEMLETEKSNETDKERIAELEEEMDMLQDTVNALFQKERTVHFLVEDARKVAIQVLETYGSKKIGNKLMGAIEKGPWEAVCKEKFKDHPDGWEMKMTKIISEWETRIGDQAYHPYKMVKLEGNEMKRIINEDDEFIKKLKQELGAELLQTVATAFFEIEEYNASGRYPMNVAWNFQKKEQVQLTDLLLYLRDLLDATEKQGNDERKRVRAY